VTGLDPDHVQEDLRDHVHFHLGQFPAVPDDIAETYSAEIRRGRQRHEALVEEHAAYLRALGEERRRVSQRAADEKHAAELLIPRDYRLHGMPRPEGADLLIIDGEHVHTEQEANERLRRSEARRLARDAAELAAENFDVSHRALTFGEWMESKEGKAAAKRVDLALEAVAA
jgi:hypothetical protein